MAQQRSTCLITERMSVQFPPGAGRFSLIFLRSASLNRSLEGGAQSLICFKMNALMCSLGQSKLNAFRIARNNFNCCLNFHRRSNASAIDLRLKTTTSGGKMSNFKTSNF